MPDWMSHMRRLHFFLDGPETSKHLSEGVWEPLIQARHQWKVRQHAVLEEVNGQPQSIVAAALNTRCDKFAEPTATMLRNRVNYLRMLENLRCGATSESITAYVSFITDAEDDFVRLVKAGDSTALMLIMYWCRLFSKIGQWWLAEPARLESRQVRHRLWRDADGETSVLLNIISTA